jgi:hypothetical protein
MIPRTPHPLSFFLAHSLLCLKLKGSGTKLSVGRQRHGRGYSKTGEKTFFGELVAVSCLALVLQMLESSRNTSRFATRYL